MKKLVIAFVLLIGTGCAVEDEFADDQLAGEVLASDEGGTDDSQPPAFGVAIVAGGCFWGVQAYMAQLTSMGIEDPATAEAAAAADTDGNAETEAESAAASGAPADTSSDEAPAE